MDRVRVMKTDRFLVLALAATLSACGGDKKDAAREAAESQRPSAEEIAAVEAATDYRAPASPNPAGVTEDDIVILRDGDHYKMGYKDEDGSFIEIPERGTLPVDDSGFLPPYPIYDGK